MLEALGAERLDDRHREPGPRWPATRSRLPSPAACAPLPSPSLVVADHEVQRRGEQEGGDGEQRVEHSADHEHADEHEDGGRQAPEGVGEQVADGVDVAGDAGDEVALLPAGVEEPATTVAAARRSPPAARGRSARRRGSASSRSSTTTARPTAAMASTSGARRSEQPPVLRGQVRTTAAPDALAVKLVDGELQRPRCREAGGGHRRRCRAWPRRGDLQCRSRNGRNTRSVPPWSPAVVMSAPLRSGRSCCRHGTGQDLVRGREVATEGLPPAGDGATEMPVAPVQQLAAA